MKKFCFVCIFTFVSHALFSQGWAEKHFNEIVVDSLYGIRYVGRGAFVARNGLTDKYGYVDRNNKIIIPFAYEWLGEYSEELIQFVNDGKYGFINASDKIVIQNVYKEATPFHEGVAAVSVDGEKFGFINRKGESVIPFKFDYACQFSEGLAAIKIKEKWGYIDHRGAIAIDTLYDSAGNFALGSSVVGICEGPEIEANDEYGNHFVYRKVKYGLIDHNGQLFTALEYDKINERKGDKYIVEKDNRFGVIDIAGQLVLPCIYDGWSNFGTYEALWLDGEKTVVDDNGKITEGFPADVE